MSSFLKNLNVTSSELKTRRVSSFVYDARDNAKMFITMKEMELRDLEKKLERTMDLGDDTTLSIANRISKANPKEIVRDIFNLRIQIKAVKEDLNEMRQAYAEYFPEGEKVEVPQE